jgi:hypothetical protein
MPNGSAARASKRRPARRPPLRDVPGGWAWERAIPKEEYVSFPGEYIAEVPINIVGYGR